MCVLVFVIRVTLRRFSLSLRTKIKSWVLKSSCVLCRFRYEILDRIPQIRRVSLVQISQWPATVTAGSWEAEKQLSPADSTNYFARQISLTKHPVHEGMVNNSVNRPTCVTRQTWRPLTPEIITMLMLEVILLVSDGQKKSSHGNWLKCCSCIRRSAVIKF